MFLEHKPHHSLSPECGFVVVTKTEGDHQTLTTGTHRRCRTPSKRTLHMWILEPLLKVHGASLGSQEVRSPGGVFHDLSDLTESFYSLVFHLLELQIGICLGMDEIVQTLSHGRKRQWKPEELWDDWNYVSCWCEMGMLSCWKGQGQAFPRLVVTTIYRAVMWTIPL